jgi:hypothetical protein
VEASILLLQVKWDFLSSSFPEFLIGIYLVPGDGCPPTTADMTADVLLAWTTYTISPIISVN